MWIAKDMQGFVELYHKKPFFDKYSGNFSPTDSYEKGYFELGKIRKLGIELKRGECKRVKIKFEEVK